MMKQIAVIVLLASALPLGGCISYQRGPAEASDITDLRSRTRSLEDRITRLEQKVDECQKKCAAASCCTPQAVGSKSTQE